MTKKAGFTITKKAGIARAALEIPDIVEGKLVAFEAESVETDVTYVRFKPAIKLDIYLELIEKARILLRI